MRKIENKDNNLKNIFIWLCLSCAIVAIMIFIGGLTRSTNSGLSMVDWGIISGIIPPITTNDWLDLFNKYKEFPEYKLINTNMDLNDFKFIFWMEYAHRILGRTIFLIILIPFIYFLKKKIIPIKLIKHFFMVILLVVFQGLFGWYMVKSGLIDKPDVSHYRLATHLTIAFFIYGYLLYLALTFHNLIYKKKSVVIKNKKLLIINSSIILLILITVFSGGMVAGLNAGLIYNTFPLMGENLIPKEIFDLNPTYLNFFENPITVQFDHRFLGMFTFILVSILWIYAKKINLDANIRKKINILLMLVLFQISLGAATLISYVNITIALSHQFIAIIIYSVSIWILKSPTTRVQVK